ncbi:hypothetical protein GQ43DRAFT_243280 [Delitschia confertaspora ATCC 74209]|uniref:Transmembrane protein n=1 Tax=Delitschia confertaspora ATCC 74209 TaxID=1513339 RepID=A0A9P4JCL3_9PLEO|nr:hypothetical protein GQ43DRAFT_243280 [Delitschia confertaspora ATCC 74209]
MKTRIGINETIAMKKRGSGKGMGLWWISMKRLTLKGGILISGYAIYALSWYFWLRNHRSTNNYCTKQKLRVAYLGSEITASACASIIMILRICYHECARTVIIDELNHLWGPYYAMTKWFFY